MGNSETGPPANSRTILVKNIQAVPPKYNTQIEAICIDSRVREQTPPKIRVTISNLSDRKQEYSCGLARVFTPGPSEGEGAKLILIPEGYPVFASDTFLRPTGENYAMDSVMKSVALNPGKSAENDFIVWDYWENNSDPFLPGEYSFETEYHISPSAQDGDHIFTWGFKIVVK